MSPYLRKVTTASEATAVQIVEKKHGQRTILESEVGEVPGACGAGGGLRHADTRLKYSFRVRHSNAHVCSDRCRGLHRVCRW